MGWIKEERRKRTKEDQARVSGREKGGQRKKNEKRRGKGTRQNRREMEDRKANERRLRRTEKGRGCNEDHKRDIHRCNLRGK